MAEKRKRAQNFTVEEKDMLLKLLLHHKEIILNKKTDGATNESKNSAWIAITNSYNSSSYTYRNKKSLMKMWEKLKSESKKYYAQIKNGTTQTEREPLQIDPVLDRVCSFLGWECTDWDAETGHETEQTQREEISDGSQPRIFEYHIDIDGNVAEESKADDIQEQKVPIHKTPMWSRRRSQMPSSTEQNDAISSVSYSIQNVYKRKETVADLREQILREELEFKRKLYGLQLQAAAKEVEIKIAILDQVRGGGFSLNNLYEVQDEK